MPKVQYAEYTSQPRLLLGATQERLQAVADASLVAVGASTVSR